MVPKRMDSTNQKRLAHFASAHCDVFQARPSWQGIVKFYKGSIFVITGHNLPSKVKLRNNQTKRNVYMWMQH